MRSKKFLHLLDKYPRVIREYCDALGWDYEKFKTSISDEGISHQDLYLEDPNEGIIDKLSQFLDPSNQSSICIIWDDVGMGKSSIRDFVGKSLDELEDYYTVMVTDPRMTSLQILKLIAQKIGADVSRWNGRGIVKEIIRERLVEIGDMGMNLVLWVDEAESIDKETIAELKALSDVKNESGAKTFKIILSGTPGLIHKIEKYRETDPEEAAAFDDRASMNTFRLNRWSAEDVYNYWELLADYCGEKNPFTPEARDAVYEISEGKPRTIAQITRMTINQKAMQKHDDLEITSNDVLMTLRGHLEE